MEKQSKSNNDLGEGRRSGNEEVVATWNKSTGRVEVVLRVMALSLTLVAAIILGVDKETQIVPITLVSTLPPLDVPVSAKWHYLSAFLYFVVANSIACAYAAVSVILSLMNKHGQKSFLTMFVLLVMDTLMIALLFSSNGAALAIGIVGYKGNSHVQWKKVCNVFGKFCNHAAASIVVSLLGSTAFILLVLLATLSLRRSH